MKNNSILFLKFIQTSNILARRMPGFFLFAVLALAVSSQAAILSWSGGGGANANWNNSANWGFAGTPANGDTLIFSASQPNELNTNNIAGLTLNQIRFVGAGGGYDIHGNAFTITNSIEATNSAGANTIENNIILANVDQSVDVAVSLTLSGALSGSVGLVKNGAGTLLLSGPVSNSYGGTTTVNGGTVQLAKANFPAVQAIPGNLVIGNGLAGATVQNIYGSEFVPTANVTINNGSLWDLNSNSEIINTNLTLSGGTVNTESGMLSLPANSTITLASGSVSTINGNLSSGGGTLTLTGNGFLICNANLSGSMNVVQNNVNTLWYGANTFTGNYTANGSGYVLLGNSQALGNTNNMMNLNGSSYIYINGNINLTNRSLTVNSSYNPTVYAFGGGSSGASWRANFTNNSTCFFQVATNTALTLYINTGIAGAGGITKYGPGSLTLGGSDAVSSYTGDTTVNEGILYLDSANVIRHGTLRIGDGVGGAQADIVRYLEGGCIYGGPGGSTVVITNSGLLDLNGFYDDVGPITMDGATINTGASGTLALFPPLATIASGNGGSAINGNFSLIQNTTIAVSNNLSINANISGFSVTLTKTGPSFLYLNGTNSYTGTNLIQQGWMYIYNSTALGSPNNSTVVSSGATLAMNGNFAVTNASLTLNGPGEGGWSALDSETSGGTNTWVGPIFMTATSTFGNYGASWLRLNSTISGPGGLEVNAGSVSLDGSAANTYAGLTTVDGNTELVLNTPGGITAIPGNLLIDGYVYSVNGEVIANSCGMTIDPTGTYELSPGHYENIDGLMGSGSVLLDSGCYIGVGFNNGSSTFSGTITGPGYSFYVLYKAGSGTFTFNGSGTYTNPTYVAAGTLLVNGNLQSSSIQVAGGAQLGGSGTVGIIAAGGTIAPGNPVGTLTSSNVTFSASGKLAVSLAGPTVGTGYDQLNVTGTNTLAGATLSVVPAFTTPVALGQQFTILNNDLADAITGTFNGLAEGATISAGGYKFTISYVGGTGNDVVLTLISIPGAVAGSTVTSGDGSHGIDPNGCNNLALTITNTTGSAMSGINATLSTTTPGVLITQPYSPYPNIPASGKGTNLAPFQISTLPSFVCGTPINLQLSVDSSLGSFTMNLTQTTGESAAPTRFDNNINTNVPDVGSIDSTNLVASWTGGAITKVTVSLWLGAPIDSDLSLSLIAPDGTTVSLVSGVGGGANFGTGSADASRTTFDDAAATAITAGTSPFVGTFRPQSPLSAFIGTTANGAWHLHIQDGGFFGSPDTLRNWSLFLSGTGCATGSGSCDYCLTSITGSITNTDPLMTNRFIRNGIVASCGAPKAFPGVSFAGGPTYHYDLYSFTNTSGADACVTVLLTGAGDIQAGVYLNAFDPSNISLNYLADSGGSTLTSNAGSPVGPQSCSAEIPAGAKFLVEVNEIANGGGSTNYTLQLSGLPCPPPTLAIQPVTTNKARLYWPTWAGGYLLEATPSLTQTNWASVTNEPIVSALKFNVTNSTVTPTNRFYRLRQP